MNLDPLAQGIMAKAAGDLAHTEAETAHWSKYAWAQAPDGNPDQIPDHLLPKTGCPECGSVWTSFFAVGFVPDKPWTGKFLPDLWCVEPQGFPTKVSAIRLTCAADHRVEFDGTRTRVMPPVPEWFSGGMFPLLAAAMLAGYIFTRKGS